MPQTPSTRWSTAKVFTTIRELIDDKDGRKIIDPLLKYYIQIAMSDIIGALNSSVDPTYSNSQVISVDAASGFMSAQYGFTVTDHDWGAKTIEGDYTQIPIQVGWTGSCLAYATGGSAVVKKFFMFVITNVVVTGTTFLATYQTMVGNSDDPGETVDISYYFDKHQVASSAYDLSSIKYDRIISIVDSNVGECKELTNSEFNAMSSSLFPHMSYADDIVWTQVGNNIYFKNGSRVTPGTKTLYYQRQPNYPSSWADNEYIDVPDKYVGLLIKRVLTYCSIDQSGGFNQEWAKSLEFDLISVKSAHEQENMNKLKNTKQSY